MKLREYQQRIADQGSQILKQHHLLYLAMEVRTGKTLTSLEIAKQVNAKNVLFLTKKKAISSIKNDYTNFWYNQHFNLFVTNDESLHKIDDPKQYDLIIHDEHHRFGAFPKPGTRTRTFKKLFSKKPMIFLSGTPTPESYSQIYHQFWISIHSPFQQSTFYKFAHDFVDIKERRIGHTTIKDYSNCSIKAMDQVKHLMISFSQSDAGFTSNINEHILTVTMPDKIKSLIKRLHDDRVIEGKEEVILADTAVKLMNKTHQLSSGTIKFESGNSKVLSTFKADFIKDHFTNQKIAIFYKFKEEWNALKMTFKDDITADVERWREGTQVIALQIQSGREGISLKEADALIFYNIDFSAVSYWQGRDRMTTMKRLNNDVFWIFSDAGIEKQIYKAVNQKKDYTLKHFKNDYHVKTTNKNNQKI